MVEVRHLGGALARPPATPSAVNRPDARFHLFAAAVGAPGMDGVFRPALDAVLDTMRPWSAGTSQVNFLTSYDTSPDRVRAAYGEETFARLVRTKRTYDPKNLFRVNHNIPVTD